MQVPGPENHYCCAFSKALPTDKYWQFALGTSLCPKIPPRNAHKPNPQRSGSSRSRSGCWYGYRWHENHQRFAETSVRRDQDLLSGRKVLEDETSWRVFNDKSGKKKSNRWWLWVIAGRQAVVYILDKSRSRSVPSEFFAASVGVLTTDRYGVYKSLGHSIRNAWCWVHVRRDFLRFLPLAKFSSWAKEWLHHIGMLFALNEKRFRLWADSNDSGPQWKQACLELNAHVDFLQSQWDAQLQSSLHKEQRTAVLSLKRHWEGLTLFLQDPRIPLHNNRAERLLRPCVINRKNSYGSGAEWAGDLAAKFFSIFQTSGTSPRLLQSMLSKSWTPSSFTR